jgi:hypothetical protein
MGLISGTRSTTSSRSSGELEVSPSDSSLLLLPRALGDGGLDGRGSRLLVSEIVTGEGWGRAGALFPEQAAPTVGRSGEPTVRIGMGETDGSDEAAGSLGTATSRWGLVLWTESFRP